MDGDTLQDAAAEVADELPGASLSHPFGPAYDVFKVRGKVFMILTEVRDRAVVVLKSDPEESRALREQYRGITPGYHMNKKHWISVGDDERIDEHLLRELAMESYRLVVAGLPRWKRPIDTETFGSGRTLGTERFELGSILDPGD